MSYFGTREQAKADGKAASKTPDVDSPTSPVGSGGGTEAGGAPMGGASEFSQSRTRTGIGDHQKTVLREKK